MSVMGSDLQFLDVSLPPMLALSADNCVGQILYLQIADAVGPIKGVIAIVPL